mmetsp:Transcript_10625/g.19646  ORF Transcript_10625/g.19646 Transcript_10625/m.19646 type:complete len:802 (-) Transcript_10625:101-2506(-)
MRAIVILSACLAWTGPGLSSGQVETVSPSEGLAKLLFAFNPAAGHGRAFAAKTSTGNTVKSSEPVLKGIMARRAAPKVTVSIEPPRSLDARLRARGGSVSMEGGKEEYEFEAEVSKVMDIIINSLYSDKDIFLRELVSNAADACDKKRILALTSSESYASRIRIKADKEKKELWIEDNGIGMTRKELQENLGRIAQSGTKKFSQALDDKNENNLIGQFGVGFYSAFLVADKVTVVSKFKDGPQLRWESESANKYTISEDDSEPIENSGTRLILTMKEDAEKYLDDYTLRGMLKKYSEFVGAPIELWAEKTEYDTVPDPDAQVEEGKPPKTKTVPRTENIWEKVNVAEPLWQRRPQEVKQEEYDEFYKVTFKQYDKPLAKMHFALEGMVGFKSILFLPSTLPWELSQEMFNDNVKPMKLYVKRVFISDKFAEELVPRWLSFLKGIVDSDDLPLNVSRELLQKSRVLAIIRKRVTAKAMDMLKGMQKDDDKFDKLQKNFGKYIKVGLIEDKENKDTISKLVAYTTSASNDQTTFESYVSRMKEGQKTIYYLSAPSKEAAAGSPVLEKFRKKGIEVLYALDQIDEISLQNMGKYQEYDVKDAGKMGTELDDSTEDTEEEKKAAEEAKTDLESTTAFLKKHFGKRIQDASVSNRLTESPSALLQPSWGVSPMMQKFMKAQAAAAGQDAMLNQGGSMTGNLEINPNHVVVNKLKGMVEADGETPSAKTKEYAELLYDVAAMSSGWDLDDPTQFSKRIVALMEGGEDALAALGDTAEAAAPAPAPAAAAPAAPEPAKEDAPIDPEVL